MAYQLIQCRGLPVRSRCDFTVSIPPRAAATARLASKDWKRNPGKRGKEGLTFKRALVNEEEGVWRDEVLFRKDFFPSLVAFRSITRKEQDIVGRIHNK